MHVILWEFRVRRGREREFEEVYGPRGEWARLFALGAGYLGTALNRDPGGERRYVVVDRWASREAYEAFRRERGGEYEALDRRCEDLTEHEAPLEAAVLRAGRGQRTRAALALAGLTLALSIGAALVLGRLAVLRDLAGRDPAAAMDRMMDLLRLVASGVCVSLTGAGAWMLWLSARAVRAAQFPPPGAALVRDTRLAVGERARRIGWGGMIAALLLLALGVALPYRIVSTFERLLRTRSFAPGGSPPTPAPQAEPD